MRVFLLFIMLLPGMQLMAQGMINSGAKITMADQVIMTVQHDFHNEGELNNGGLLNFISDWFQDGIYSEQLGKVMLSGNQNQTIHADVLSLSDLTIAGTGEKILGANTTLSGVLDFVSAKVLVEEEDTLRLGSQLELYGVNDQSYIIGRVFRRGEGTLEFPIGSHTDYLPVTLYEVEGSSPLIGMEATSETLAQPLGEGIEKIASSYWTMTKDENYTAGYISLPYDDQYVIEDVSELVVVQGLESGGLESIGAGHVDGDVFGGVIRSEVIALGTTYTIGYLSVSEKIPLVRVINALTPYEDGRHDFLRIENIEYYFNNEVKIYDRQGGLVWVSSNYNNVDKVFKGVANTGSKGELADGNYFYTIQHNRKQIATGFIFLKR